MFWKLAESFGATCCDKFEKSVTHVLAVKPGTHKVNEARENSGTYLVNANWLYESVKTWQRANEFNFPLENLPVFHADQPSSKRRKVDYAAKSINAEVQTSEGEESVDEMASLLEQELMDVLEEDD